MNGQAPSGAVSLGGWWAQALANAQGKPQVAEQAVKNQTSFDPESILEYYVEAFLIQAKNVIGSLGVDKDKIFLRITRDWKAYLRALKKSQNFAPPIVAITMETFTPAVDRINPTAAARSGVHDINRQEDGMVNEFKPMPMNIEGRFIITANDKKTILTLVPYIAYALTLKWFSFKVEHDKIPGGLTGSIFSAGNAPSFTLPDGKFVELEDDAAGENITIDLPYTAHFMFGLFNKVPVVLNARSTIAPLARKEIPRAVPKNAVVHA